jgi:hypothetical protein
LRESWKETEEYDFLIVSEPLQTIFHIEVNVTCSKRNSTSAARMLEKGLHSIRGKIIFPGEEKWKYVGMMYFGLDDQKHSIFCPECQKFVLGPDSNIWAEITKNIEKPAKANPFSETYLKVMSFLLFQLSVQESGAMPSLHIDETNQISDKMTTLENICFWSNEELDAIKTIKNEKRVALTSEFGTGKTSLLKEVAEGITNKKETVTFVIFESDAKVSLLKLQYEKKFKYTDSKIVGIGGIDGNCFMQA